MKQALDARPATGNYFVSAYPPFSCWKESGATAYRHLLNQPAGVAAELGIYIHVPFCVERCQYCYYLSYDDRPEEMLRYTEAVTKELRMYSETPALAGREPAFIYFGGGTPSLLPVSILRPWIEKLKDGLSWKSAREITFECAPRSVSDEKAQLLRDSGVTRVSIGVQQLDDAVLQQNGRIHLTADVDRAYRIIRRAGFRTVNIDLIAGLIGETDESFFGSLERVLEMTPDSITIYLLEIPFNTPLHRSLENNPGAEKAPDWPVKRRRLGAAFERLQASGYAIRSAYTAVRRDADPGFVYQDDQYHGADLLGVGVSSFSYLSGTHQQNQVSLPSYLEAVARGDMPLWRAYALTAEEQMVRELVLQMKLGRIDCSSFEKKHSVNPLRYFEEPLTRLSGAGMLTCDRGEIRLTAEGLLRVDHFLPEFYLPQHRGRRYS